MRDDLPVPGDLIWIRRRQWRVRSALAGEGLTRVLVSGLPGAELRSFLLPCERWNPDAPRRTRVVSTARALGWLAACAARAHRAFVPAAVIASRTEILAYQLEPALAILAGRRRILIADDVGLGKTIQAGLIVAEVIRRRLEARILVIAPASLLAQWSGELRSRFGLAAQIADADRFTRLRAERPYLDNPWQGPGVWLVSPDYMKQPHVIEGMPACAFDLVVIDEAHLMSGNSQRSCAADAVARSARHVVLLTATPHDGDDSRFRRLLSIGATGSGADALTTFRRTRRRSDRRSRMAAVAPGPGLSRIFTAIDMFSRAMRPGSAADGLQLVCAVFRKRALSSVAALIASVEKRIVILTALASPEPAEAWIQPSLGFAPGGGVADEGDVLSPDEHAALMSVTGLSADRERAWLNRLLGVAAASPRSEGDPKVLRLTRLLERTSEPVVVFTEYRDTLLAIADHAADVRRVAVLHGGLSGSEQRKALDAYLSGRADALLATDVASQGLNLQHRGRWVVHFDLPWTPLRLEQRVGRVDRIGQARRVHVTVLALRHQAERAQRDRVSARQETSDAAAISSCGRWTAASRRLAEFFAGQRALAARWRGPDLVALPSARASSALLTRLGINTPATRLALVEVPLMASSGEVVERHIGWCSAEGEAHAGSLQPPGVLVRRARALTAQARSRLARHEASCAATITRTPHQPGLFEPQRLPARHEPIDALTGLTQGSASNVVSVQVGQPRALIILERR